MQGVVNPTSLDRWVDVTGLTKDHGMPGRCTVERLQASIGHLGPWRVTHASHVSIGSVDVPRQPFDLAGFHQPDVVTVEGLPEFCDVRVEVAGDDGVVSIVTVWVPVAWNGRFLGLLGGATRTEPMLWEAPSFTRSITLPVALRNGFATAKSDGGNRDNRFTGWALPEGATDLAWPLIESLAFGSTRTMTLVAKAVIEALTEQTPRYNYLAGCSGGGRQALAHAQRYPADYDGYWAANPAIHWSKFVVMGLWAPVVMKDIATISEVKLELFRQAAIASADGCDGLVDGVVGAFEQIDFDPSALVGRSTPDGPITEQEAHAMRLIWRGPRRRTGEFLWYGMSPGTRSWGVMSSASGMDIDALSAQPAGMCSSTVVDAERVPLPFPLMRDYVASWVLRDPSWDWTTLTLENFEDVFDRSVETFAVLDSADPDLSGLEACGARLLLSHGAVDELIPFEGTVAYFDSIIETRGSASAVHAFARLFVSDGDGHSDVTQPGPGLSMAGGMAALMRWVEVDQAPDQVIAQRADPASGQVVATRPLYPYPLTSEYSGFGDPTQSASFRPRAKRERESGT